MFIPIVTFRSTHTRLLIVLAFSTTLFDIFSYTLFGMIPCRGSRSHSVTSTDRRRSSSLFAGKYGGNVHPPLQTSSLNPPRRVVRSSSSGRPNLSIYRSTSSTFLRYVLWFILYRFYRHSSFHEYFYPIVCFAWFFFRTAFCISLRPPYPSPPPYEWDVFLSFPFSLFLSNFG